MTILEAVSVIIANVVILVVMWYRTKGITAIDDAINHRHERSARSDGSPPPKIYDLVLELWENQRMMLDRVLELEHFREQCPLVQDKDKKQDDECPAE